MGLIEVGLACTYMIISWQCCFFIVMDVDILPITIRYIKYEHVNVFCC
jgi:hypothetical protein